MTGSNVRNPQVPSLVRGVAWVESAVAFAAGMVLFFAPATGSRVWAWSPPPFNARFLGAIYFAALTPLLLLAIRGRWAPGRLVLWMTATFTSSIMVVMFFYRQQFEWARPVAWAFWFLLILLPILSAAFLARMRDWGLANTQALPGLWARVLTTLAVLLAVYGLVLLAVPRAAASFWPWPVDEFHGRIYVAIFWAPAVGAWLVRRGGNRWDYITLGLTLATLGVFAIVGVVWTDSLVPPDRQVDFRAAGTVLFMVMNIVWVILGGAMVRAGANLREALT